MGQDESIRIVHEDVLAFVRARAFRAPRPGQWNADQVLAHLVAIDRMIAAAAAELLSGGIPVVDNRPAQSVAYLNAIVAAAGGRDDLLQTLDQAGREVALLADQLEDTHRGTNVPTIVVDAGAVRVQQPRPFSVLLEPGHVVSHLEQLAGLAERS
ncbi:MAG TPA: hypothetical protein VK217_00360 [Acidimicrobiales bacterium]|nr:hypothetical protein [Acidimicrobiales bacterium]